MNEFELFTMIYYALDAYYEDHIDDYYINCILSDMCPFTFKNIGSADPAMYIEYLEFLDKRKITLDNSLDIAKDYLKTIDFADVTPALKDMDKDEWIEYCKEYLSEPHKGEKLEDDK